jgi:hypothetical protein
MPRLNSFKIVAAFVTIFYSLALSATGRQLECSYDYVTHKTVKTISETDNGTGNLNYTYHHEFGSGGKDMWAFSDKEPPTLETKSNEPYTNMWGNMFNGSDTNFPDIVYINFETVKFHQIQVIDAYLKDAEKLPHGYVESNRVLEIPVILWDCKRLD